MVKHQSHNQKKSETDLVKALKDVDSKRWLFRKKKKLQAELSRMETSPDKGTSSAKSDVSPSHKSNKPKKSPTGFSCVTRKRTVNHHTNVIKDDPLPNISNGLSSYGEIEILPTEEDMNLDEEELIDKSTTGLPEMDLDGEDFCVECNEPMRLVPTRALMVCTKCGCFNSYIDATTNSMAYGDEIEISSMYCYKRLNHFRLQLSQLQATESTEISQDTIDKVMSELVKKGITKPDQVTVKAIRDILKKLKQRKCYDHIPQIYSRITGIPPIRLTPELEEKLRLMFINIQEPFEKHCPPTRKNFISYRFLLYKFFEILGYDECLPFLSLLKGKDKLMRQDAIYRECCKELDWTFIPSIH